MTKLLSTKILSSKNHKKISDSSIEINDYNAIKIENIDFNINQKIENAIFTSKNSVKAILNKKLKIKNCYRVG